MEDNGIGYETSRQKKNKAKALHKSMATKIMKERIDIFSNGKILQIDNFKTLKGWGFSGFKQLNLWRQDKGVKNLVNNFLLNISLFT